MVHYLEEIFESSAPRLVRWFEFKEELPIGQSTDQSGRLIGSAIGQSGRPIGSAVDQSGRPIGSAMDQLDAPINPVIRSASKRKLDALTQSDATSLSDKRRIGEHHLVLFYIQQFLLWFAYCYYYFVTILYININ